MGKASIKKRITFFSNGFLILIMLASFVPNISFAQTSNELLYSQTTSETDLSSGSLLRANMFLTSSYPSKEDLPAWNITSIDIPLKTTSGTIEVRGTILYDRGSGSETQFSLNTETVDTTLKTYTFEFIDFSFSQLDSEIPTGTGDFWVGVGVNRASGLGNMIGRTSSSDVNSNHNVQWSSGASSNDLVIDIYGYTGESNRTRILNNVPTAGTEIATTTANIDFGAKTHTNSDDLEDLRLEVRLINKSDSFSESAAAVSLLSIQDRGLVRKFDIPINSSGTATSTLNILTNEMKSGVHHVASKIYKQKEILGYNYGQTILAERETSFIFGTSTDTDVFLQENIPAYSVEGTPDPTGEGVFFQVIDWFNGIPQFFLERHPFAWIVEFGSLISEGVDPVDREGFPTLNLDFSTASTTADFGDLAFVVSSSTLQEGFASGFLNTVRNISGAMMWIGLAFGLIFRLRYVLFNTSNS